MDPVTVIGLAGSIIAVLQLTSALIKPATSSLGPSENDQKELERLLTTMKGFQIAYNNLEHYFKANPGQTEMLATAIQQPITECKAVLAELKLRLSRLTFVRKHIIGKKWDKGFHRLVKRLDDARQLFDVILQGDQSQRLIKISEYMEQNNEDIDSIKEGIQSTETRLAEIHLTVEKNQRTTEARAAQHQAELISALESFDDKIQDSFSYSEMKEQRKTKDKILQWLTVTDPRLNHDRACKSHKAGTGEWFTKGAAYRNWLAEPNSFVWLNGKAGCGKTVLSSTIIEQTAIHCDENEGCVMGYFYFSFTDKAKQQCSNMLCSLLEQLLSQVDNTPECLLSLYRKHQRINPSLDSLKQCLQKSVTEMASFHVYLIVDALDEIPNTDEREEVCKVFGELSQNPKTHILTTSRREHDLVEYLSVYKGIIDMWIQNLEVNHDILQYVQEQLKEDKKLKRWFALHSEIEENLSSKAQGMFRWAACQLDTLRTCRTIMKVRETLNNLPKTLDETYERILLQTDQEYRGVIVEALRWLCFSTERLTVGFLAAAAVFSAYAECPSKNAPLEVAFNPDALFQDSVDIVGLLSGLVVCVYNVNDNSSEDDPSDNDDSSRLGPVPLSSRVANKNSIIQLSHFSVKEFLASGRLRSEVEQFCINEIPAYEILTTKCLHALLYHQSCLRNIEKTHPGLCGSGDSFVQHASEFWASYARKVDNDSSLDGLISSVLELDQDSRDIFLASLDREDIDSKIFSPLAVACDLGLFGPCKLLLEKGANADGVDLDLIDVRRHFAHPISSAVRKGHEKITQILLDYGAQVNIRYEYGGTVFGIALATENVNIVKLLLDYGADLNREWLLVFRDTILNQKRDMIQLLLDYGAEINRPFRYRWLNALQLAIESGREWLVRLLLDRGASVNTEPGFYDSQFDFSRNINDATKKSLVMILENGAVMSSFRGGNVAKDALATKQYERFAEIQMDLGNQERKSRWERRRENIDRS